MHLPPQLLTNPRHINKLYVLFALNIVLAFIWGPIFIGLTLAGPAKALSQRVEWVAVISYYANMMTNVATAASVFAALVSHRNRGA